MNVLTSQLAAHSGTRQLELLHRADGAADAADRAVVKHWNELTRLLKQKHPYWIIRQKAAAILWNLYRTTHATLHDRLTDLVHFGHSSAVATLMKSLPTKALRVASYGQRRLEGRFIEEPGFRQFGLTPAGQFASRSHLPSDSDLAQMTDAEQRHWYEQLLFKPPSEEKVRAILRSPINGRDWQQDLAGASKIAGFDPERMADVMAINYSQGKQPREIAQQMLPVVDGVKTSARRIARTYGMEIAHAVQQDCHDQLGNLVIGYQTHCVSDQNTRSWHAARSGTIYYKNPQEGQKGYPQMPHPPLEAEDAGERPAGTPQCAPNCRCHNTVVLTPMEGLADHPAFIDQPQLLPDPAVYHDWFAQADTARKKLAVGARRLALAVQHMGGAEPEWAHFVEPTTGVLLTHDQLKNETEFDRRQRINQVNAVMAHHRHAIQQTATFGFIPPAPRPQPGQSLTLPITTKRPAEVHLPGHGLMQFVPDPIANPRRNVTILVDPAKLDRDWQQDEGYYIPRGGGGAEIAGRRAGFAEFLGKGRPIEASRVALNDQGHPSFENGRHRFSVLRDRGASLVAVTVPRKEAAEFLRRYGR